MRKAMLFQYVPVLPRQLRFLSSMDSLSNIPDSMLTKLAEKEREEEKARKFSRRKHFKY